MSGTEDPRRVFRSASQSSVMLAALRRISRAYLCPAARAWRHPSSCAEVPRIVSPCCDELLARFRIGERFHDLGVEPRDDLLRRAGRRHDREPRVELEARQSRLGHRRHVGELRQPLRRRHADQPELSRARTSEVDRGDALNPTGTWPPAMSSAACVAPLYGTCVSVIPAFAAKSAIAMCCGLPLPPEP